MLADAAIIETMFDRMCAGLDEAALIAAIGQASRDEARAGARKLAAIAELVEMTVTHDAEHDDWAYDSWCDTASQVGAVLSMGQRRASAQMRIAIALREVLPEVAAAFCQGRLGSRLVAQITWRTRLVEDPQARALIDAALARTALAWGPLSEDRLNRAIDAVIARYDPDAVMRAKESVKARDVRVGAHEDPDAVVSIWGQLMAADAAALQAMIAAMVTGVCADDPRTAGERRSDAVGALIHGNDHLPCRCGSPACAATGVSKSRVVISVIADAAAVDAAREFIAAQDRDQQAENHHGESTCGGIVGTGPAVTKTTAYPVNSGLALLPGVKVLPLVALAEAVRGGAAMTQFRLPGPDPEPHYRPSVKLAAFVRARDMFCRFPGCDVPAQRCDIDHVVPWPYGPTHASNLTCTCRTHHLGKTFWEGWRDVQFPNGTVVWTTPSGQSYTTFPGSRLFFPRWNTATTELQPMDRPPPDPDRAIKMPKRRRSRAAERTARINAERADNATARAHEQVPAPDRPPPTDHPHYGNDPPPF